MDRKPIPLRQAVLFVILVIVAVVTTLLCVRFFQNDETGAGVVTGLVSSACLCGVYVLLGKWEER